MPWCGSCSWRSLATSIFALSLAAAPAGATTLDMIEGTTDSIGDLEFMFGQVTETPGIDLSQIDLVLVSDSFGTGFDLVFAPGALKTTSPTDPKDIDIEFKVTSSLGIVQLYSEIDFIVDNGTVVVSEFITELAAMGDLGVSNFTGFDTRTTNLGAPYNELNINSKDIAVAAGVGGSAEATLMRQRFNVIPEPSTSLLFLSGLVGIAWAGRRR